MFKMVDEFLDAFCVSRNKDAAGALDLLGSNLDHSGQFSRNKDAAGAVETYWVRISIIQANSVRTRQTSGKQIVGISFFFF
jgi:hypothetical protein